jgi:hypothetical protein
MRTEDEYSLLRGLEFFSVSSAFNINGSVSVIYPVDLAMRTTSSWFCYYCWLDVYFGGRTACVKTCNSQDTMSTTWRKERSTVETKEIMKTAADRSECHDGDVSFCLFCLMSWCLSWRSWCAAALRYELPSPAQTLGSWHRIPLKAWMFEFFLCLCCLV